VNGDGSASRSFFGVFPPYGAATVSAAATVLVELDRVNAVISRCSASCVPPHRIGGMGVASYSAAAAGRIGTWTIGVPSSPPIYRGRSIV
jgi:hypothetical protein